MLKQSRKLFSTTPPLYDIHSLGKNKFPGYYTEHGNENYLNYLSKKGPVNFPPSHFKFLYNTEKALGYFGKARNSNIQISNLGIGSYLGDPTPEDDFKLFKAVEAAINGGINFIDTAANYRYGKSERVIGAVLRELAKTQGLERGSLFLASKIGFITPDPDRNFSEADIIKNTFKFASAQNGKNANFFKGLAEDDFIAETHSVHPAYIAFQLEQTLANLNIETLDLLYLHNVAEAWLAIKTRERFFDDLKKAFEFLESLRQDGKIRFYGLATWNCFRAKSEEEGIYLSLQEICELAKSVGGETNGFRFIQMPMNLIMHEAFTMKWQKVKMDDGKIEMMKALEAAQYFGVNLVSSAPLLQTFALRIQLPFEELGLKSNAQAHLQLMRSMPAEALKSTLVGFKSPEHIAENLGLLKHPLLEQRQFSKFLMSLHLK